MQELLAVYEEIIRSAEDHQIVGHLTNLVQDAAAITEAVKSVVDQARARVTAAIPNQAQ